MEDLSSEVDPLETTKSLKHKKKIKKDKEPGIIYLSKIPSGMNVKILRHMMEIHGEIGRIFLQPNGNSAISPFVTPCVLESVINEHYNKLYHICCTPLLRSFFFKVYFSHYFGIGFVSR